jgi:hypothetical protein
MNVASVGALRVLRERVYFAYFCTERKYEGGVPPRLALGGLV